MKSGSLCAMKDCRCSLISEGEEADPAVIGEAAHIYGENPGTKTKSASARYRENMLKEERNHYDNLIYLCSSCHTKIDKQEQDFPASNLFDIKKDHEAWVEDQLDCSMSEVTFAELEITAKAIASGKHASDGNLVVLPPEEKIKKNSLGAESRSYISMGLSKSAEVTQFLSDMSQLDDQFPIRLKNGFKEKYDELKKSLSGDELFMGLLDFAHNGQRGFKQQAASLALLSHLFHLCEIFEK